MTYTGHSIGDYPVQVCADNTMSNEEIERRVNADKEGRWVARPNRVVCEDHPDNIHVALLDHDNSKSEVWL